jgi:hypothetical protein
MTIKTQTITTTLEDLAKQWKCAKAKEVKANASRIAIEEQIAAMTGVKTEGSETHEAGAYKVTVTGKLTYSAQWDKLDAILPTIPLALQPVKVTRALDATGLKFLKLNEPDLYQRLADGFSAKPAKTSIEVKDAA